MCREYLQIKVAKGDKIQAISSVSRNPELFGV